MAYVSSINSLVLQLLTEVFYSCLLVTQFDSA
jgi:hypothetical protein